MKAIVAILVLQIVSSVSFGMTTANDVRQALKAQGTQVLADCNYTGVSHQTVFLTPQKVIIVGMGDVNSFDGSCSKGLKGQTSCIVSWPVGIQVSVIYKTGSIKFSDGSGSGLVCR